jgi:NAD(P)-dependent dehydrogenase (short-subunit alcohol dehydrogenase family)
MPQPMRLRDRTAVITGAAGGIGRALSIELARRGTHLALADVDDAGLRETASMIAGVRVSIHHLDVSDKGAVDAFPTRVLGEHPRVDILVNNAGVALGGTFEQIKDADFEWLFGINFWGVVNMTRAFLSTLRSSDDARVVNVSSLFGLIAPPGQSAYAASKFAVRGFSQSLRLELTGTNVGVSTVHPGGVATSIARNARRATSLSEQELQRAARAWERALRLPPETAAQIIVGGIEQRKPRILVGRDANVAALLERLFPTSDWSIMTRLTK